MSDKLQFVVNSGNTNMLFRVGLMPDQRAVARF